MPPKARIRPSEHSFHAVAESRVDLRFVPIRTKHLLPDSQAFAELTRRYNYELDVSHWLVARAISAES